MLFPKTSLNRKFTVLLNYLPKNGGDPHVYIHSGGPGLNPFWPHMFRRSSGYLWNCNHAETNNAGNSINSTTLYTKNACTRNKIHLLLSTFSFKNFKDKKRRKNISHIIFVTFWLMGNLLREFMRKCLIFLFSWILSTFQIHLQFQEQLRN